MRKISLRIVFSILVVLLIGFVYWNNVIEREVEVLIETQERFIKEGNKKEYMSNISSEKPEYFAEKESWIRDLLSNDIENYELTVKKVRRLGFKKVQATVVQTYTYQGRKYETLFPLLVVKEGAEWKDSDLNFRDMNTENFTIKYFRKSKTNAKMIKSICEEAKTNVEKRYGTTIDDKTIVKVYEDLELLRQSVKLSFPWQFAGWYEYPESIKTSEYESKASYQRILEHELVHKVTIKESNNNMPYWFTEGLAVYFSNFYNDLNQITSKEQYFNLYGKNPLDIKGLEQTNLEKLEDSTAISQYYDSAGIIVKFMVDNYGIQRVKQIVAMLGKFPYQVGTGSEVDREAQKRFHLVIPKALGVDIIQLNEAWNDYSNN